MQPSQHFLNHQEPYFNHKACNFFSQSSHPALLPFPVNSCLPINTQDLNGFLPVTLPLQLQKPLNYTQLELLNRLMAWKYQNYLQDQMMTQHIFKMLEIQNYARQEMKLNSLYEEMQPEKVAIEVEEDYLSDKPLPQLCDANKSTKAHLKDIMYFILDNSGKLTTKEFKAEKLKYRNNKELCVVFDILLARYNSIVKTKEDMARCLFKKVIKHMKQRVRREVRNNNNNTDEESANAGKGNLKVFFEQMSGKTEENFEGVEHFQKLLNPIDHITKNVMNNSNTIAGSFCYEDFYQGFQEYVENLDHNLALDNNKKTDRFVKYMEGLMKKGTLRDTKKYKRIPWLKTWIESTKKIAYELAYASQNYEWDGERKIVKKEEEFSNYEEDDCYSAKLEQNSD